MGTGLSSKLGKVKAVRKRNGAPPQLHHCQEEVGSLTGTSLTVIIRYGQESSVGGELLLPDESSVVG